MKKKISCIISLLAISFLFISCGKKKGAEGSQVQESGKSTTTAKSGKVYVMGVVPQFDARRIQTIWNPILAEVSRKSGVSIKLMGSPNIPEFEKEFNAGKFDFAYMNPYHAIVAEESQGYTPIIRDIGRKLYGVLVTLKDSPISTLSDLKGKKVAFPSPNALGASLMPRAEIGEKHGFDYDIIYAQSHSSVYLNVALGQAHAGGGVQKTLEKQPEEVRSTLRVFHRTPKVAPHPVVVHSRIEDSIRSKIQEAFLELGETESGRALLSNVPIKKVGKSTMEDYAPLLSLGLGKYYQKE